MKKNFEHTEQIEKYLEGQMTVEEKNAFELRLQNDPELNSEFQFQTETIEAIKAYRKAELKARLENLNVGTYGISLPGIKIAAIAAITATVGLGIYFYQTEEPLDADPNTELAIEEESLTSEESPSSTPEVQEETASVIKEEPLLAAPDSEKVVAKEEIAIEETTATEREEKPVPTEERDNTPLPERNRADIPSADEVAALEIENKEDTKHTFHYKFYNSKLYLYGDFKSVPYEIIEYNTLSGKSLYLYYQDRFYYLEANQMEISPLQKVREEKLIEELDSLRIKN